MIRRFSRRFLKAGSGFTAALLFLASSSFAADPPDAGQTFRELKQESVSPQPSAEVSVSPSEPGRPEPGGPQVELRSVRLHGNTVFSDEVLLKLLEGAEGKSYDLAGLNELAYRITAFYHENDYPFARALIPAQPVADGVLKIEIVEGRYGDVSILGEGRHAADARGFLEGFERESVIEGKPLERAALLLNDQPGYSFVPVMRPGQEPGTGDLSLQMRRENLFSGGVRFDNHGNRYTGRLRWLADLSARSLLVFGDQLTLGGVYAEWDTWFGSAGYSLPVGSSGLRANAGYDYTYYQLGKEFEALDAYGTAHVLSGGLTYPFIRTQRANLSGGISYQHKRLEDNQDTAGVSDEKHSNSMPVVINFDLRDFLFGGGITYGAAGWTFGVLDLNSGLAAADGATAKSEGPFHKMNLDIARLQNLPGEFSLYGMFSGQLAFDNLDSSEDFGLGGPNGVRAYPVGEGYGDEGLLTQLELRYDIGPLTPYGFYDFGYHRTNSRPWSAGDNDRSISGAGFGLRFNYRGLTANFSIAWRGAGGRTESDSDNQTPMIWFHTAYRF